MKNVQEIITLLQSESYSIHEQAANEIALLPKIKDDLLDFILAMDNIEDDLTIADCLQACQYFTKKQLRKIKNYIRKNLNHSDELFRRNLLEIACSWHISGFFEDCLGLVANPQEDVLVINISCVYVYEHMKITDLPRVREVFEKVLNHPDYYQNSQMFAAFYLFKLTHQQEYFDFLKESMAFNNGYNI